MEEARVLSRLREVCLRLPEVRETIKWGHPTFEAGKKMFAVLDRYAGRACIAFRASSERRPLLLADQRFFEAPYAARHGWVCLRADGRLNWREIEMLLLESYRLVALKRMVAALDDQAEARGIVQQRPKHSSKTRTRAKHAGGCQM
jgi:predicted DNA-binding protein (MmcQ/YjbR family)